MKDFKVLYAFIMVSAFLANSCEEDEKAEPALIKLTSTPASVHNGKDGAISVEITGGQEPFYYFWSTGDSTRDITGLYAGDYSLKVIYGKNGGSIISGTARVEQPVASPLGLSFSVTDVSNFGNPLGKISLVVSGGTPPYSYLWSNGDTIANPEKLYAGEFMVTVQDNSSPYRISTTGSATVGQPEFVCGQDSITDMDGYKYPTVQLGEQCWIASNLRTIHDPSFTDTLVNIEGRFCYSVYCNGIEGAHYTWDAMMAGSSAAPEDEPDMEVQGICPSGWHIPTKSEFDELDAWLKIDGNGGAGKLPAIKLRGENSSSGFDALLIGNYGYNVYELSTSGSFWTSTEYTNDSGQGRIIFATDNLPLINKGNRSKSYGLSVRCLKDSD